MVRQLSASNQSLQYRTTRQGWWLHVCECYVQPYVLLLQIYNFHSMSKFKAD